MSRFIRRSLLVTLLGALYALPIAASPATAEQLTVSSEVDEIRELFERTIASQSEIQRLSLAIAMHQSSLLRLDDQLETLRGERSGLAAYVGALTQLIADARREEETAMTPGAREEAAGLRHMFEVQLMRAAEHDREMRAREGALTGQRDVELRSWTDLASRLTQLTTR